MLLRSKVNLDRTGKVADDINGAFAPLPLLAIWPLAAIEEQVSMPCD
jgi:hypothetical protein